MHEQSTIPLQRVGRKLLHERYRSRYENTKVESAALSVAYPAGLRRIRKEHDVGRISQAA
jgi:hypothetical protein